MLATATTQHE